jgi:PAS domain S-box-containing protein
VTASGTPEDPPLSTRVRRSSAAALRPAAHERLGFVRSITQHLGEGVAAMDTEGRLTFFNRAAEEMLGWPEEAILGRRLHDFVHYQRADGSPLPAEECPMRAAIQTGETVRVEEDVLTRRDGTMVPVSYVCSPIFEGRAIVGAVLAFRDSTERTRLLEAERAVRDRLAFLAEVSETLASSLDYQTTLARIARLAVPRVADWCAIDMLEPDGSLRRVETSHVDPAKVQLALELAERYPTPADAPYGVPHVVRSGQPELYPEITDAMLAHAAADAEHLELNRSIGMRSAMTVPLRARGRTLGAITFVTAESGRTFGPDDLAFAEDLARRAAVAVDNARLYSERASVARTLQQSLLPPHLPKIAGVEIAARYHAAGEGNDVGGDFYDVFRASRRGRWIVVMGDVCGKGAEAAAVTGLARYTIRAAAMQQREPSRILGVLNDAIRHQRSDERFATVAIGALERSAEGLRITVASGGHPAPFVIRADGRVSQVPASGMLLGAFPDPGLGDVGLVLGAGDAIVFFTDGVTESRHPGGEDFGLERLSELLGTCDGFSAAGIAEQIERAVLEFQQGVPRDDVAILALRVVA